MGKYFVLGSFYTFIAFYTLHDIMTVCPCEYEIFTAVQIRKYELYILYGAAK